jgi:unsaturated rhamnogalacturonyl hydrolase
MNISRLLPALLCIGFAAELSSVSAQENFNARVDSALADAKTWPGVIRSDIGVTRRGTKIPCLITADDLDYGTKKTRILVVGLGTIPKPEESSLALMKWFYTNDDAKPYRKKFAISAVPMLNVDGWATNRIGSNLSKGTPSAGYPPQGNAYNSPTDPEAAYVWRWIGMHAPDLVTYLGTGSIVAMFVPEVDLPEMKRLPKGGLPIRNIGNDLVSQLVRNKPANVGAVPTVRIDSDTRGLRQWLVRIMQSKFSGPSPARRELQKRLHRTPIEVAKQLAKRYGHDLNTVAYIPALALVGRIRLGELTNDASHLADIERIVKPYVDGKKPTLGKRFGGSNLSGHLIFGELARATKNKRYVELTQIAADKGFDEEGQPRASMPAHSEMSDSVFMGCPILVQAGKLTGEKKYHDMALTHLRFMQNLALRKDGVYRNSPLDEAAWGRGNGFPALGVALCLTDLPKDHPAYAAMLASFRAHMRALKAHQDPTGTWHQVIDHTGSYREFTCTCMITFAMLRGLRNGWLDEREYRPVVDKAWKTILTRIAADATLVDVCTGTGKQKNLHAYLDRTAILGHDARGGAMALMVVTEREVWRRSLLP